MEDSDASVSIPDSSDESVTDDCAASSSQTWNETSLNRKRRLEEAEMEFNKENIPNSEYHPALISEVMRKRVKARNGKATGTTKKELLKTLSDRPKVLIDCRNSIAYQIEEFFQSPVPVVYFGRMDRGENMLGSLLEYNLRKLIGAHVNGDFENMISRVEEPNLVIDTACKIIASHAVSQKENFSVLTRKLTRWGKYSSDMSKVWDRSIKSLQSNKNFLQQGMYCESSGSKQLSSFYSDEGFTFPLPIKEGETILNTEKEFELPFEIEYLVDEAGGFKAYRSRNSSTKPSKFTNVSNNIFVDRKPRKKILIEKCNCEMPARPDQLGCGETCLNRYMYIECTADCPLGKACSNRRFQLGTKELLDKVKVNKFPGRGFGIQATAAIPKDSFILEYRGEVISNDTLMERMANEYKNEKNYYFLNYGANEVIDGFRKGTIARFANHSCEPNCRIEKWNVDGEYRVGLFASKNISPGDELTYDYKFESFGMMQECHCGSKNCRGFIGLNKKDESLKAATKATVHRKQPLPSKLSIMKAAKNTETFAHRKGIPNSLVRQGSAKSVVPVCRPRFKLVWKDDDTPGDALLVWKKTIRTRPIPVDLSTTFLVRNLRFKKRPKRVVKSLDRIIEYLHQEVGGPEQTITITHNGRFRIGELDPLGDISRFLNSRRKVKVMLLRNIYKSGRLECTTPLPFVGQK